MFLQIHGENYKGGRTLCDGCCLYSAAVGLWGRRAIELKGTENIKGLSMHLSLFH